MSSCNGSAVWWRRKPAKVKSEFFHFNVYMLSLG